MLDVLKHSIKILKPKCLYCFMIPLSLNILFLALKHDDRAVFSGDTSGFYTTMFSNGSLFKIDNL
jgi:hypothetical protein